MEKEKRKRGEKESKEGVVTEKKKIRKEEEASEEEVEEFFAILRRMRAVFKYFEKGGGGEGWRAAVEAERAVMLADDDAKGCIDNDKTREAMEENGVLDLNAAPDEEENPIS
ncbi:hypothetical protein REPUB_Repub07fG0109400 [Reevesia pubescens]